MDTKKRPIIIDTDPGIDDAVALAIALNHPNLEVRLITTVAGNVDVEKTTNNALKLVDFFGKKVPVAKGVIVRYLFNWKILLRFMGRLAWMALSFRNLSLRV